MPVTMSKINLIDGIGPVLQIAEGYTVIFTKRIKAHINNGINLIIIAGNIRVSAYRNFEILTQEIILTPRGE